MMFISRSINLVDENLEKLFLLRDDVKKEDGVLL